MPQTEEKNLSRSSEFHPGPILCQRSTRRNSTRCPVKRTPFLLPRQREPESGVSESVIVGGFCGLELSAEPRHKGSCCAQAS